MDGELKDMEDEDVPPGADIKVNGKRGRGMFKDEIRLPAYWGSQEQREQWEKDFLEDLQHS